MAKVKSRFMNRVMGALEKVFRAALNRRSPKMVQNIVLNTIKSWADATGDRYGLAVYMQPYLSERFGHPLCGYCQWVIWPEGEPHEHCQHVLKGEMQCPFCNAWVPDDSIYCDQCGGLLDLTQSIFLQFDDKDDYWEDEDEQEQKVVPTVTCTRCGYDVPAEWSNCSRCGAPLPEPVGVQIARIEQRVTEEVAAQSPENVFVEGWGTFYRRGDGWHGPGGYYGPSTPMAKKCEEASQQ